MKPKAGELDKTIYEKECDFCGRWQDEDKCVFDMGHCYCSERCMKKRELEKCIVCLRIIKSNPSTVKVLNKDKTISTILKPICNICIRNLNFRGQE